MSGIIDLSHTFTASMPVYTFDEKASITKMRNLDGNEYNDWQLVTGMHVGTHIDGAGHLTDSTQRLSDIAIDTFVGAGYLIDARNRPIEQSLLKNMPRQDNLIVLILTGSDKRFGSSEYFTDYPVIPMDFAEELIKRKVKMVGIDFFSPDKYPFAIHKLLFEHNTFIIENLTNLERLLPFKKFKVFALPLKTETDSALARVIAVVE